MFPSTNMLQLGDLYAWISTDGISNECFAIEQPTNNSVACWIASETGKKFAVNWFNASRAFPIQGVVSIDGTVCDNHVMLDYLYPDKPSAVGVSHARTSDYTQRDFMFSTIEVTDDDEYLYTLGQTYNFGTITLDLWRLHVTDVVRKTMQHQYGSPVLESQIVHERSKKAGTHHVKYGEEYHSPSPVVDMVTSRKVDQVPFASFTFRYRPLAMLMANGIVPRPSNFSYNWSNASPNSRAVDNDESAAAEIRRLESRLNSLRSQVGRADPSDRPSRKIKVEPDNDYLRASDVIDLT